MHLPDPPSSASVSSYRVDATVAPGGAVVKLVRRGDLNESVQRFAIRNSVCVGEAIPEFDPLLVQPRVDVVAFGAGVEVDERLGTQADRIR